MQARLIRFGLIEIDGKRYEADVLIEAGKVRRRRKKPSKPFRDRYGHTPLSADEHVPWGGRRLVVGAGVDGALPVMPEVIAEAERRGIELVVCSTAEACRMLSHMADHDAYAVLHVTC